MNEKTFSSSSELVLMLTKVRNPRNYLEEGNYSILCLFLCDKFCSCDQVFTMTWNSGNDVNCNRGGLVSNPSLTLDDHGIVE